MKSDTSFTPTQTSAIRESAPVTVEDIRKRYNLSDEEANLAMQSPDFVNYARASMTTTLSSRSRLRQLEAASAWLTYYAAQLHVRLEPRGVAGLPHGQGVPQGRGRAGLSPWRIPPRFLRLDAGLGDP